MAKISLKNLTDRQREVWRMRYQYGWRVKRIALELGTSWPNVCQILRRARHQAGLPYRRNISVIRTKPRVIRGQSLSRFFGY